MARCACSVAPSALGLTSCYLVPSQIRKLIFTTNDTPLRTYTNPGGTPYTGMVIFSADTGGNPWAPETGGYSPSPAQFGNLQFLYYFPYTYALQTELADDATSEREDPTTQTIGGYPFFVRSGNRSLNLTWVGRAAELVWLYEQLRCQKRLFVFLVDNDGVVWGARVRGSLPFEVKPIPVLSATINSKLNIPTTETVESVTLSLLIDRRFSDGDFVPVASEENLTQRGFPSVLGYRNLIALSGNYEVVGGNLQVAIFFQIHAGTTQISQPLTGLVAAGLAPVAYDINGTSLGAATAEVAPGVYQWVPAPAGWAYVAFNPLASVVGTPYDIYDFYGFRVNR